MLGLSADSTTNKKKVNEATIRLCQSQSIFDSYFDEYFERLTKETIESEYDRLYQQILQVFKDYSVYGLKIRFITEEDFELLKELKPTTVRLSSSDYVN